MSSLSLPPHSPLFLAGGEPSSATFRLRPLFRDLWGQRLLLFSAARRGFWLLAMERVLEVSSEQFFQSGHTLAPWQGFKLSGAEVKSEISHGFCSTGGPASAQASFHEAQVHGQRLSASDTTQIPRLFRPDLQSSGLSSYLTLKWNLMNTSKHAICHSLDFSRIGK